MKRLSGVQQLILFAFCLMIFSLSCTKEDKKSDGEAASGRFSGNKSCDVIVPPASVNLDAYYKKYINCSGIPVIGNADIPDEAIFATNDIIEFMLRGLGDVRAKLESEGAYYALAATANAGLAELPEIDDPNQSGIYGSQFPIAVSSADNVLCLSSNPSPGRSVVAHEFVHMMHLSALRLLHSNFNTELKSVYDNAKSKGLWQNTYAISAPNEFLAEGVMIWYGVRPEAAVGGDGFQNEIFTREALLEYDPMFHAFIAKYFNADRDMPGCVQPPAVGNKACVPTVTDVDGNVYNVVSIGNQCWMQENLRTTHFNDGTPITQMTDHTGWQTEWTNATKAMFAHYDHNVANNSLYGKYYNWYAAGNPKICPKGWHIPSHEEVELLLKQVGGNTKIGAIMSTSGWDNNPTSTNSSGFSLVGSGYLSQGHFADKGEIAYMWTSREGFNNDFTIAEGVKWVPEQETGYNLYPKSTGIPCRCVMD